ncbi:dynamin family protein [Lampropedia aestuarii]|uniref:dynamin family protein n=1 Tax=Lampropedia aestuarii TaxID=2562762 RepID=UPI0024688D54|nr:dynamin family protein [Lampropedia aestuarii]MDH5855781.1 50S ribosome-binding GTPase [Lampropedia aestuarii]
MNPTDTALLQPLLPSEQALMDCLSQQANAPAAAPHPRQPIQDQLWDWQTQLHTTLLSQAPDSGALQAGSALAAQLEKLLQTAQQSPATWHSAWAEAQATRQLAASFDAPLMLLVFGKFNAGKSSLCNFLARRWAAQGWSCRYFYFEQGRLIHSEQPLAEGATETTARMQGVVLGEQLVLLDTPGLHSVTPENAELTQRFTDSADAVLWLTSSTAPGQVQELDALVRELQRHKPLLPVITRSDVVDEDEIDGRICTVLCNKTPDRRAMQEQDVAQRTHAKLQQLGVSCDLLRPPVSISVHMAQTGAGDSVHALQEAGFAAWFAALHALAEPAQAYKQRKSAEVLLHHMQEQVLAPLQEQVRLPLLQWMDALDAETARIAHLPETIARTLWRQLMPQVAQWIAQTDAAPAQVPQALGSDAHAVQQHMPAARAEHTQQVCSQLQQALQSQLLGLWQTHSQPWRCAISAPPLLPQESLAIVQRQAASAPNWAEALYGQLGQLLQSQLHHPDWLSDWLSPLGQTATQMQERSAQWLARLDAQRDALTDLAHQLRAPQPQAHTMDALSHEPLAAPAA